MAKHRLLEPLTLGRVVGDVVDTFTPSVTMKVTYSSGRLQVMVDPDSPSPSEPYLGEHLHWIVINIPGTTDAFFGTEVVSYEMPTPSIGVHRYVFVLFKQKERRPVVSPPASRDCFNTKWFAEEHSLGLPVAAVYFYARRKEFPRDRGTDPYYIFRKSERRGVEDSKW